MRKNLFRTHAIPIALAWTVACATHARAEPPTGGPEASAGIAHPASNLGQAADLPPPIALTADDVTHFTAALEELRDGGLAKANDTSQLGKSARTWAANQEAVAVLQRHALTSERFEQIAYSVGMAMAALDIRDKQAEIDAARVRQQQALAQMKAQVTPEQYEIIRRQFEAANSALDRVQDQPAQNLRLVAEHRQAIENAIKN